MPIPEKVLEQMRERTKFFQKLTQRKGMPMKYGTGDLFVPKKPKKPKKGKKY